MASDFGKMIKISLFGQSHGQAVGVLMDGLPAGEEIDTAALKSFLARRAPGQDGLTTSRNEKDEVQFLSGLVDGKTCGAPLCALIENKDAHSRDYAPYSTTPRPGHADYTATIRYHGHADLAGGGHFSGRLTAPLCVAGGICKQILERKGIHVGAHLCSAGQVDDERFPLYPTAAMFAEVATRGIPTVSEKAGGAMEQEIRHAAAEGNSVGGTVECAVIGLPAGIGGPLFDGLESRLSRVLFGIPAVKGVEFGDGFAAATSTGKQNNDEFKLNNGIITTNTNHCGGILGGISNGMPVTVRVAFKPTPSIGAKQKTVDLSTGETVEISVQGRHDPCVALRAVAAVEAAVACVILDMRMEEWGYGTF